MFYNSKKNVCKSHTLLIIDVLWNRMNVRPEIIHWKQATLIAQLLTYASYPLDLTELVSIWNTIIHPNSNEISNYFVSSIFIPCDFKIYVYVLCIWWINNSYINFSIHYLKLWIFMLHLLYFIACHSSHELWWMFGFRRRFCEARRLISTMFIRWVAACAWFINFMLIIFNNIFVTTFMFKPGHYCERKTWWWGKTRRLRQIMDNYDWKLSKECPYRGSYTFF